VKFYQDHNLSVQFQNQKIFEIEISMMNMPLGVGSKPKRQMNNNGMRKRMTYMKKSSIVRNYMKHRRQEVLKLSSSKD
jgi:hypothetical protein